MNKRLAQGARSREEILEAASRLMSAKGYEGTSVADIARESGLPNSSIYWHFSSKAGVLAAVMERGAERFFDSVPPPPRGEDETPEGYLRRALLGVSAVFVAQPEFLRLFVLLLLSHDSAEISPIVARVRSQGRANLQHLLRVALTPWGPEIADTVAERIVDLALAGFDGAFLALQATGPVVEHDRLMSQLADALIDLAVRERATLA